MHESVMTFVAGIVEDYDLAERSVLEVGSLDVNGSTRSLFHGPYVGIDMQPGVGVDYVVNAHDLPRGFPGPRPLAAPVTCFDVIVCAEMLEHDDAPWLSLAGMRHSIQSDGFLIVTARGYDDRGCFPLHSYPHDLWRYSVEGMRALLVHTGWSPVRVERDHEAPGVLALAMPT